MGISVIDQRPQELAYISLQHIHASLIEEADGDSSVSLVLSLFFFSLLVGWNLLLVDCKLTTNFLILLILSCSILLLLEIRASFIFLVVDPRSVSSPLLFLTLGPLFDCCFETNLSISSDILDFKFKKWTLD